MTILPNLSSSFFVCPQKVLSTSDLISLGVGSCAGTGMYLVSGMVAKTMAGPAVVLSYTIAGFAALLSGLCYAELGVRVPYTTGNWYMIKFFLLFFHHFVKYLLMFYIHTIIRICLCVYLCDCWRICGLYYWLEYDFRVYYWYCFLCLCLIWLV